MKDEATLITELTSEVRTFIKAYVHSVWQLELISHMRAQNESMTVHEIAKLLYSTPAAIESTLERFANLGIITKTEGSPDSYVFSPASNELKKTIDDAVNIYSTRRIEVINLIFSSPQKAPRLSLD